jgi:UDP-N-acetylglucosamine 1-carboxyvinyltransferase
MGVAEGESTVTETVFKSRFGYLEPLKELGLNAETDGEKLYIHGKCEFKSGCVKATDLRGGAALIIAALAAKGESKIENAHYIIRGYSDTVQKLTQLGADIKYIEN